MRVATLYAGEVLGLVLGHRGYNGKQFQARALEEVHALAFDGARLRHACEEDYAFGFRFMRAILQGDVGAAARDPGATGGRCTRPVAAAERMNIGVIRERGAFDRRVALTPPVVRRLCGAGHTVWVETGAGDGAMFRGCGVPARGRADRVLAGGSDRARGTGGEDRAAHGAQELQLCAPGMALMAFYHMAVADRGLLDALAERCLTAIGCEVIQQDRRTAAGAGGDQRDRGTDDHADCGAPAAVQFRRARHSAGRDAGRAAGARGDAGRGRGGIRGGAHRGRDRARG